jgi:hypothetical protein
MAHAYKVKKRPQRTPSPPIDGRKCFCGELCDPEESLFVNCSGGELPDQHFTCPDHGMFAFCCGQLCILENIADEHVCGCTPEQQPLRDCVYCRENGCHWDGHPTFYPDSNLMGRIEYTDLTNHRVAYVANSDYWSADGDRVDIGIRSGSTEDSCALSTGPDGGMFFSIRCLQCKKLYRVTDK